MSDARSPEDLLQSALSSAFTPVSIAPAPPDSSSSPATLTSAPFAPSHSEPLISQEELAKHEEERAALERSWREASAQQRQEAEERRARMASGAGAESWDVSGEKEIRGPPNPLFQGGGGPADVRDVVSGEPSGTGSRHAETSAQVSPRTTATLEQSQRWEEIESLESSYPSLSFPDQSDSAPSSEHAPDSHFKSKSKSKSTPSNPQQHRSSSEKPTQTTSHHPHHLPSATLSIFDPALPPRARLIAFLSSLSINFLLPFVNGVMLGFGEIFARNVASRFFGWGVPASTESTSGTGTGSKSVKRTRTPGGAATAVGVGAAPLRRL